MNLLINRLSSRAISTLPRGNRRTRPLWLPSPRFLSGVATEIDDPPLLSLPEMSPDSAVAEQEEKLAQIRERRGIQVEEFFRLHLAGNAEQAPIIWSIRREQVESILPGRKGIGVLQKVNNSRWVNKYFRAVNNCLAEGAVFAGCAEVNGQRKKRLLKTYPPLVNYAYYYLDFLAHRIWPKLPFLRKAYFVLTKGHSRPMSVAEVLGRLVSCGFEIIEHREIGSLSYFAVRKVRDAAVVPSPTYGPICTLNRVGRGEALVKVYKLRTMHPYAEFLQDYVYKINSLDDGGKFRNDFRVPKWGKWLRRLWIDELPMLINVLKGEMKLVGVRPLSPHYFSLYPVELQMLRKRFTPGLLPPFYVDLPRTFDEIVASELAYLRAHEKSPIRTDIRYFFLGVWNIVVKRARSA